MATAGLIQIIAVGTALVYQVMILGWVDLIRLLPESACDIFSQQLKHALNIRCLFMLG